MVLLSSPSQQRLGWLRHWKRSGSRHSRRSLNYDGLRQTTSRYWLQTSQLQHLISVCNAAFWITGMFVSSHWFTLMMLCSVLWHFIQVSFWKNCPKVSTQTLFQPIWRVIPQDSCWLKSKNACETALALCASHGALGLPEPSLHVAFQTQHSLQIQARVAPP